MAKKQNWKSYAEAKRWASKQGFISYVKYRKWVKHNNPPEGIPKHPKRVYGKSYIGDKDFFGHIDKNGNKYMEYFKAQDIISTKGLMSKAEFHDRHDETKPQRIPKYADSVYGESFGGWIEFLGKKQVTFRPYAEAIKFVHLLRLKSHKEWKAYAVGLDKPADIPKHPDVTYGRLWVNWPTFLGYTLEHILDERKDTTISIFYIIREDGEQRNVLTFGVERMGRSILEERREYEHFTIIKTYRYEPELQATIDEVIAKNGTPYYGSSSQFVIPNVNQLMWDVSNVFDIVS